MEHLLRLIDAKPDKLEFTALKQEVSSKSERADVDLYVRAVQGQRNDFEARQSQIKKEFDALVGTIQMELESLKATTLQSLQKKADFNLVDQLRETLHKKVDHDYL